MHILERAVARARAGVGVALATVVDSRGSVPRHPSARMLVEENGNIFGTIGGGRVEQEVTRVGARVAAGAAAELVAFDLVRDLAMCCGGSMTIYVEPVAPVAEVLASALARVAQRQPALLTTDLGGGGKQVDSIAGGDRQRARRAGDRFLEPLWPADRLLLFGCGHVARAIGPLAASVGFEVAVCDDDETGALAEPSPWASHVVGSFEITDVERALGPLGLADWVLVVTRDHEIDQRLVEKLLPNQRLTYLGLIGSRGKIGRFRKRLLAKGVVDEAGWERLRAPIGLDIGAETPTEIAVATVAELIALRRADS